MQKLVSSLAKLIVLAPLQTSTSSKLGKLLVVGGLMGLILGKCTVKNLGGEGVAAQNAVVKIDVGGDAGLRDFWSEREGKGQDCELHGCY